jgi:hypothetical protein
MMNFDMLHAIVASKNDKYGDRPSKIGHLGSFSWSIYFLNTSIPLLDSKNKTKIRNDFLK